MHAASGVVVRVKSALSAEPSKYIYLVDSKLL